MKAQILIILQTFFIGSTYATVANETIYGEFTLDQNDYVLAPFDDYPLTPRIIGGQTATPNQFPYLVGIIVWLVNRKGWCGGSIISDQFVLTAAQCLERSLSVSLIFGAQDRTLSKEEGRFRREVTQENFILHALWNPKIMESDLGLVLVTPKISFSDKVQPIALPYGEYETQFYDNFLARTCGWGRFAPGCKSLSNQVNYFQARVLHNTECLRFYPKFVRTNHICLDGSKGQMGCEGDLGGPMVIAIDGNRPMLIGVLSFSKCCESRHPTVFTRVTQYLSWIHKYMNQNVSSDTAQRG